ncbi:MAG: 16S rRNA (guanine(527)-N(7))-methyltransferase RsmG [Microcoleaceae cyanobacterium]
MGDFSEQQLPKHLEIWRETLSWQPSDHQQQQFQQLYAGILAGNQQLNLTRITQPDEFWEKHLWDSLWGVLPWLAPPRTKQTEELKYTASLPICPRILDIGTGGGFPGLPVAIAFPDAQVTLLDSIRKKITFLESLIPSLEFKTVDVLIGRAEQINQDPQQLQQYDLALIRAVSTPENCAKYALPFLKSSGYAVLYRGQWTEAETQALEPVVERLGGTVEHISTGTTPLTQSSRHCIYLRKH